MDLTELSDDELEVLRCDIENEQRKRIEELLKEQTNESNEKDLQATS